MEFSRKAPGFPTRLLQCSVPAAHCVDTHPWSSSANSGEEPAFSADLLALADEMWLNLRTTPKSQVCSMSCNSEPWVLVKGNKGIW